MKTAISVPDPVFDAADDLADRLGLSRSALYTQAVSEFLERHRSDHVTEKLNLVYSEAPSHLDPVLRQIQVASLPKEEW
jgi:hypothetical protein